MFLSKDAPAFLSPLPTHHLSLMSCFLIILLALQCSALHLDQTYSKKLASLQRKPQSMRAMISVADHLSTKNDPSGTIFRTRQVGDDFSVVDRSGFTFDPCMSDGDCHRPRNCSKYDEVTEMYVPCSEKNATVGCTCDWERKCEKRADCPRGEVCTGLDIFGIGTFLTTSCSSEVSAIDKPELVPLQNGLTMDACKRDSDCHDGRRCFVDKPQGKSSRCRKKHGKCLCLKQPSSYCPSLGTSTGCDLGERCGAVAGNVFPICVSEQAIRNRKDVYTLGGALGLQMCARRTDCAGDRDCIRVVQGQIDYCAGREECFCGYAIDPDCDRKGKKGRKCLDGEICVEIDKGNATRCGAGCRVLADPGLIPIDVTAEIPCLSPSPIPTEAYSSPEETLPDPSEESEGVCVDARMLEHLDQSELVFERHRWARVLCDGDNSCATAGHMVWFKGRVMMMRTYCSLTECKERQMYVNSPRHRRGMILATNTEDLQFTAFAARYATRMEEVFLSAAIHIGL